MSAAGGPPDGSRTCDVVVVGAGIGGLAAAAWVRSRGLSVRVIEGAAEPGGKAGTVTIDGVTLDTGPSVLTMPDVFDDVLRALGTSLGDEILLRRPSPFFRYHFASGAVLDVHPELEATLVSVGQVFGDLARRELAAFLEYARKIWEAAAPTFVHGPAPSLATLTRLGVRAFGSLARIDPLGTMRASIASRVRTPELRELLARYATYNGSDPRSAPATLNCIAHVELTLGGAGVEGGIHALVRALVRALAARGVEVELGTAAERIVLRAGRVAGVALADGREITARAVVANADAGAVGALLLPPGNASGLAPAREPSMSGWTAIVRARRVARAANTVLFPEQYEAEFEDVFDRDRPPSSPTVYMCAQESFHGIAGWNDAEPVFMMVNAPPEPVARPRDPAVWSALRETVLERTRRAGLVAVGDSIVWERTPAGLAERFAGTRGSIYGAASTSRTAAFRRPANRVARVPGLYLASGSAHPGGGMPLAALSGRAAVSALLEDLREPPLPERQFVR